MKKEKKKSEFLKKVRKKSEKNPFLNLQNHKRSFEKKSNIGLRVKDVLQFECMNYNSNLKRIISIYKVPCRINWLFSYKMPIQARVENIYIRLNAQIFPQLLTLMWEAFP